MRVSLLTTLGCAFHLLGMAQTQPTVTPPVVDSMAYYNNTKKPAIGNPSFIEYAPTIQADGKTIIYQRNDGKKYNLYLTNFENGNWSEGKPIDKINASGDSTGLIGGPSLSFDGNTLYFFRSLERGDHDIFYSQRTKDGWSAPTSIGAPINLAPTVNKDKETVGGYDGFPSVSADGKTLYFVRQNLEGPRDKDLKRQHAFCTCIYKSEKESDGKWSKPEKLPWPINQECEKAPRIMADGKTLIFSSNRPGGKGGYDMYQSKLNELGEWDLPVPLNFVNTEKDDQLPCISAQGDLMYYTYNNVDIYSVVIPPKLRQFMNNVVQGFITDLDSGEGIGATVVVTDAISSEIVVQLESNPSDGRYTLVLPVGRNFNIEYRKAGYSSFTRALDLRGTQKYEERSVDVKLFRKVKLMLTVSDKELFEPILADIKIKRKGEDNFIAETKNNAKDGSLVGDLPLGYEYEIIISAPNFKSAALTFNVSGLVMYRTFEKYVELVPEKKDVMVNVSDLVNNSKVKARVVLKNKNREEVIEVTGNQMVSLRSGDRYEMEVTSDQGYAFSSGVVDGSTPIDVKLMKLEQNAKLTLRDINFESNSVKLSDISFTELNRVVQLMKENPSLKVEVAAHTDDVGLDAYNLELSDKRARSVVDFLLENKINPERFVAKGYGESQSKVPNDSDANRAINRRVELKIISI